MNIVKKKKNRKCQYAHGWCRNLSQEENIKKDQYAREGYKNLSRNI